MSKLRVCMIGCLGKMGQVVSRGLLASGDYELAAGVDTARIGDDLGSVLNLSHIDIPISSNLQTILSDAKIDIAIDFTTPSSVTSNVATCLQENVPVLVGTTGITQEDVEKLAHLSKKMATPVLIVPNFAIGALLMMEFAKKAAKYMPHAEIIELHHPQKLDKPSGTALRTRDGMIESLRQSEKAREQGIDDEDPDKMIPIHSVRLPGFTAHQEVIFGDVGQCLTIRHDSFQRESFLPGIFLGLKQLQGQKGLKVGLEL
ncbi:MAG: 4-hydroxy-tetrahydrodipicolinate reductase [bacterium ADurb.Bin374]|nr:MAG: 4-hydroxy-tetrahydrodipicolinate reductase [bacterium ADurb.Bin374]